MTQGKGGVTIFFDPQIKGCAGWEEQPIFGDEFGPGNQLIMCIRQWMYWEENMKKSILALAGAALAMSVATTAIAKDKVIGVSWSNFQEERWKPTKLR